MREIAHGVRIDAPIERVWAYVETLPNWAPFMVGFQKLEVVDDRRSIWTLRGDVGILSREVDIQADITLWEPMRRVEFTITGLTERITGEGSFTLEAAGVAAPQAVASARPKRPPWYRRLRAAVARFVLRLVAGSPAPRSASAIETAAASGEPGCQLTFHLNISPGGPMAPMLELLMAPMLEPAAEDLAGGIRRALEEG